MGIFITPVWQIRKLGIRQVSYLPKGTQWGVLGPAWSFSDVLALDDLVGGAITKSHTTGISFSQFWRLGSPRSRCRQIQFLVSVLLLTRRQAPSYCVLTHRLRRDLSLPLLIRALIPSWGAPTLIMTQYKHNYLPKASLPNIITWWLGL